MRELLALFVIYAFFILSSFVVSAGVHFIYPAFTNMTFGVLLIVSTVIVVSIFFKNFGGDA